LDVFELRDRLVEDYEVYVSSFITIKDARIGKCVRDALDEGLLWPEPLIQLNPAFEEGEWIDELVDRGVLHEECRRIFQIKPERHGKEEPMRLHRHQAEAIRTARGGHNYVLTTGTGSGNTSQREKHPSGMLLEEIGGIRHLKSTHWTRSSRPRERLKKRARARARGRPPVPHPHPSLSQSGLYGVPAEMPTPLFDSYKTSIHILSYVLLGRA
jgi:hypothetical protein